MILVKYCGAFQSNVDPCLFWFRHDDEWESGKHAGDWRGYGGLHVDDMRGRATRRKVRELMEVLEGRGYMVKLQIIEQGEVFESIGERFEETQDGVLGDQLQYADQKLTEVPLAENRWKQRTAECSEEERQAFASTQGQLSWVTQRTKPCLAYEASVAASKKNAPTIADVVRINKAVRMLKTRPENRYKVFVPKLKEAAELGWRVVQVPDAGEGEMKCEDWTKSQGGRIIGLMAKAPVGTPGRMAVVDVSTRKLKRTTHSSFDAETVNAIDATDVSLGVVELVNEWQYGMRMGKAAALRHWQEGQKWPEEELMRETPLETHTDADDLVAVVEQLRVKAGMSRRRRLDVADLREMRQRGEMRRLLHVSGQRIHADALTKPRGQTKMTTQRLIDLLRSGWYEPEGA